MSVLWLQRPFSGGSRELGKQVCYSAAVTELIIEGSRLCGFSETVLSPNQESFSREEENPEPGSCIHGNGRGRKGQDSVPPRAQQSALCICWHLQASPPQSSFFFNPPTHFAETKILGSSVCSPSSLPLDFFLPVLLRRLNVHHYKSLRGST